MQVKVQAWQLVLFLKTNKYMHKDNTTKQCEPAGGGGGGCLATGGGGGPGGGGGGGAPFLQLIVK